MAKSKRLAKLVATLLDGARAEQRWRALDAERIAKISELTAKMDEARRPDPWTVRRILDLTAQNEDLVALDAQRVAKIQEMAALDAERAALDAQRVAKIEELVALDAERVAQVSDLMSRSGMDRPLAFMHIPKTAGTALTHGLRDALLGTAYLGGFDRSMFGAFTEFESLPPDTRAVIYHEGLPPGDGADLIAGHFSCSTLAKARPDARFMTVLREPRSRILSLWAYWRSLSDTEDKLTMRRLSRQPFVSLLKSAEAACQVDNIFVRMLLWPHPLIPDGDFIDISSDEHLACAAMGRLKSFDFADIIENPRFVANMRALLARPFALRRVKETVHMPPELRVPLQGELTQEALHLLDHRSRLDRQVWLALTRERMPGVDAVALADDIFRKTVARHADLMAV